MIRKVYNLLRDKGIEFIMEEKSMELFQKNINKKIKYYINITKIKQLLHKICYN